MNNDINLLPNIGQAGKKPKRVRKFMGRLLLVLVACVFLGSGGYLLYDYITATNEKNDMAKVVEQARQPLDTVDTPKSLVLVNVQGTVDGAEIEPYIVGEPDNTSVAQMMTHAVKQYFQEHLPGTATSYHIDIYAEPTGTGDNTKTDLQLTLTDAKGDILPSRYHAELQALLGNILADNTAWIPKQEHIQFEVAVETTKMLPQYSTLYEQNQDMIGWITIGGTRVDYPVMQTQQNSDFYLHRNFERRDAFSGVPYVDGRCVIGGHYENLLVYGHNMKNGTMFGDIWQYQDQAFWRENQTIQFDLLYQQRTYQVIAAFRAKEYLGSENGFRYYHYLDLSDEAVYDSFIEQLESYRLYDTEVETQWGDQFITLSTCSYHTDGGTFVVVAKRVG